MIALHVYRSRTGAPQRDVPQHSAAVIPVAGSSTRILKELAGLEKNHSSALEYALQLSSKLLWPLAPKILPGL
jgi:hypothetical protein